MTIQIGKLVSHYRIIEKLGAGGMGVVYKAEDTKLERKVALKFLAIHLTKDKDSRERFKREARSAAALNHPNIVTIYEINEYDDQTYIAMEFVEGETLRQKIEKGPIKIDDSIKYSVQICEGLSKAHNVGIIHRDIKPENIIIDREDKVKILDFGLAKLKGLSNVTKDATTIGTVKYLSPEQIKGDDIDHRTDLWSLGVVLYEMLTGRLPYEGNYEAAIMYSIVNENLKSIREINPNLSEKTENVLNKLLRKDQENRYQSCKEIIIDLQKNNNKLRSEVYQDYKITHKRNMKFFTVLLSLVVILFSLIWYIFIHNQNYQSDSIAVLPFQNRSKDPNLEFLSREIPANLINNLSRLNNIIVIPRTTIFHYADQEFDLSIIGQDLKVGSVLTGEVSVVGENIIIRAELIDLKKNNQIWGDRFERKFKDLFEIEEQITREITGALQLHLTSKEKSNLVIRYTENIEAYRFYLEGRFWWNKRSQEGYAKAKILFNKAIAIDSNYALAYSGLAEYYCMLSMHLAKPEPFIRQGRIAAEKALSIDETMAEAHTALGWIKFFYDWDWLGGERSFKKAIQFNPRYPTAYNWYAASLSIINRHEEAIRYMTQAQEYDPGSAIINRDLGVIYAWAGDFERAIKQYQFTIDMDPDFSPAYFHMGIVYVWMKKYDLAIEYFKKVREMTGDFFDIIGALGFTYAKSGQKEEALSELKKLEDLASNQNIRAFEFSLIHAGLGNNDQAFKWLDIAYKNHEFGIVLLGCESELWFEDLLPDSRFQEILSRIGFEK